MNKKETLPFEPAKKKRAPSRVIALRETADGVALVPEVDGGTTVNEVVGKIENAVMRKVIADGKFLVVTVRCEFTAEIATVKKPEIS